MPGHVRVYEIFDKRTGERVEGNYTKREAENSIAWCFNTGGDVEHLGVRRDPTIPVPERLRELAAHARQVQRERRAVA